MIFIILIINVFIKNMKFIKSINYENYIEKKIINHFIL